LFLRYCLNATELGGRVYGRDASSIVNDPESCLESAAFVQVMQLNEQLLLKLKVMENEIKMLRNTNSTLSTKLRYSEKQVHDLRHAQRANVFSVNQVFMYIFLVFMSPLTYQFFCVINLNTCENCFIPTENNIPLKK
jgi:hypothetical protein